MHTICDKLYEDEEECKIMLADGIAMGINFLADQDTVPKVKSSIDGYGHILERTALPAFREVLDNTFYERL